MLHVVAGIDDGGNGGRVDDCGEPTEKAGSTNATSKNDEHALLTDHATADLVRAVSVRRANLAVYRSYTRQTCDVVAYNSSVGETVGRIIVVAAVLLILLCSSSLIAASAYYTINRNEIDSRIQSISTPRPTAVPSTVRGNATPGPTVNASPRTGVVREQWAISAVASSEYANPQFAARQATGAPDTPNCGDFETAWASGKKARPEWIELNFSVPVFAQKVIVHESYNPGNVVQIDLKQPNGSYSTIFKGRDPTRACPGQLSPVFEQTNFPVTTVRIYVEDPSDTWAEIDAVQLVGVPAN